MGGIHLPGGKKIQRNGLATEETVTRKGGGEKTILQKCHNGSQGLVRKGRGVDSAYRKNEETAPQGGAKKLAREGHLREEIRRSSATPPWRGKGEKGGTGPKNLTSLLRPLTRQDPSRGKSPRT